MTTPDPTEMPAPEQLADDLARSMDEFWQTLALLDPEEQESAHLADGWTPKAVVAHVAFWDDYQTRRMQAALRGASAAAGFARPLTDNDARAAEDAARPWAEVAADAEAARARLIAFARSLAPAALAQAYPEGERTLSLVRQLQHMARHVRAHARDVGVYCGSMRRWTRPALRQLLELQHRNLLDSVAGLTETTMETLCVDGDWTVRDVLAHVLSWNEYCALLIAQWPEPDPAAIAEWTWRADDTEATLNARLLAARAGLDCIALADGLATCHRKIMTAYDRFGDADFDSEGPTWGGTGMLSCFLYEIYLHEAEHAAEILAARAGE